MSETAKAEAKESGLNAAVPKTPWGAFVDFAKRFGLAAALLVVLAWRMDQQNVETREQNKALTESALQNASRLATIVEQSTAQSKQTQQAIEKFTEGLGQQQRSMERVLDRMERQSSAFRPTSPRAPVIE